MEAILHEPDLRDLLLMFVAFFLPKILFIAGIIILTLTLYGGLFQ